MPSEERYFFICNPAADSGRLEKKWDEIRSEIETYIDKDQFAFEFTTSPLQSMEIAKTVIEEGNFSHIVAVGGDGIANEVCNAMMRSEHDIVFGMIPAGTSNDAHQTHHFPNNAIDSLKDIFENQIEVNGVGKISGDFGPEPHYFLDHCDTGLAALAARSAKYGTKLFKGEWKYTFYALKNLLRFKRNPGTVTIDGEEYEGEFSVIATGFGEDMSGYHLWPGNSNKNGDFGILLARGHSRFGLLKLMLAAENGNHIGREGVDYLRGKSIEIDLELEWPYQAEGEIFTENSKYTKIEYVPDALKFLTGVHE